MQLLHMSCMPGRQLSVVCARRCARQDETDSGLDIDALKTVAEGVNTYKSDDNAIVQRTVERLLAPRLCQRQRASLAAPSARLARMPRRAGA